jgi:hypothetical protein
VTRRIQWLGTIGSAVLLLGAIVGFGVWYLHQWSFSTVTVRNLSGHTLTEVVVSVSSHSYPLGSVQNGARKATRVNVKVNQGYGWVLPGQMAESKPGRAATSRERAIG